MPNYPEQYFNQDTPAKNYSDINKAVIKEIEVSGASTDNIYIARLVKLTGTDTINLQTGDVNVKLDHTGTNFDSTRIGDGVDLWAINADGSGKISGSTIIYDSGGTRSANVLTNNALKISGSTTLNDGTNAVNILTNNALKISGSTQISDGTNAVTIFPDSSLKVSGSTILYDSGGTRSANVLTNNALKISGSTEISDGTNSVRINPDKSLRVSGSTVIYDSGGTISANILTNNSLKISGTTQIGDGTNSVNVLSNNALKISGSTQISDGTNAVTIFPDKSLKISGSTVIYNSGGTTSTEILSNNALKISGSTQIGDGTNIVNVLTNNALKISGSTQISDGTNAVNVLTNNSLKISGTTQIGDGTNTVVISGNSLQTIITDSEATIGAVVGRSKKPQIKIIRPGTTPTYGIGNIINSGGTLMEKFTIARSNDKNSWLVGGHMTSSVSATTALNADVIFFQSGFTITADNTNFDPSDANLEIYLGTLSFSTWKSMGNSSKSDGSVETPFILKPDAGTQDVYSVVQARNAYVASASEILTVNLDIAQD